MISCFKKDYIRPQGTSRNSPYNLRDAIDFATDDASEQQRLVGATPALVTLGVGPLHAGDFVFV